MPNLPRPPRAIRKNLDPTVRRTILLKGAWAGVSENEILEMHREEECYPDVATLIEQTALRYQLDVDALMRLAVEGSGGMMLRALLPEPGKVQVPSIRRMLIGRLEHEGADWLLYILPDAEFLTAIETAAAETVHRSEAREYWEAVDEWLGYTDKVLRKNGLPYRLADEPNAMRFEWIGDQAMHEIAISPALAMLADPRLTGANAEFRDALTKRRLGAAKDLEDAVDEAAKSVESVLAVLHRERNLVLPARQQLSALFNSLASADIGILPGYLDHLVCAAGGPRNNMASHGQGASVRAVPEELADASIAAAAAAITLLAHYLP